MPLISFTSTSFPPERSAVNPHAVHDHGQATRQRHDRLLHPAMPGDLHCPGLEPGPFRRTHQHALLGDLAVTVTAGSSGHTNSPHPSSREGHHSTVGWSSISSYCIGSCTDLKLPRLLSSTGIG